MWILLWHVPQLSCCEIIAACHAQPQPLLQPGACHKHRTHPYITAHSPACSTHQDDVVVLLDLVHQLLQALLKLTTVLGTGHQQAHVQGDHLGGRKRGGGAA